MTSLKWSAAPFSSCFQYIDETNRILDLTVDGLLHLRQLPTVERALSPLLRDAITNELSAENASRLRYAEERAKFAEAEISCEFPTLHAHALVSIWASLDSLIVELARAWLVNVPESLDRPELAKIRVPLSTYHALDADGRADLLVEEIARTFGAGVRGGPEKFETILAALGLGGAVDAELKKGLIELGQVRNVLVHRAGVIDRRFKATCPWYEGEVGTKIRINRDRYSLYSKHVNAYLLLLIHRVRRHFGIPDDTADSREHGG